MRILTPDFYRRDTVTVAKDLIGKRLVNIVDSVELSMRITETEAYLGVEDKACHSYGGKRTRRTSILYEPGGLAYVYLIYGMYHLLNAVTEPEEVPCAVLIRAGEPLEDTKDNLAIRRFGKLYRELSSYQRKNLLNGPGKLCKALGIDGSHNWLDLCKSSLTIREDELPYPYEIEATKRIGIDYAEEAADWLMRFTPKPIKM